jgi:hypothetical protein
MWVRRPATWRRRFTSCEWTTPRCEMLAPDWESPCQPASDPADVPPLCDDVSFRGIKGIKKRYMGGGLVRDQVGWAH